METTDKNNQAAEEHPVAENLSRHDDPTPVTTPAADGTRQQHITGNDENQNGRLERNDDIDNAKESGTR
ncbi:MAG: hypothetical protein CFE23_02500 [Flavobacterium sp. BFFFF1]|uniref:hypothetical protein n=1 Tax=unclassified Flavobacterium TaxID=196869 RepID=UPI000BC5CF6B|nr:MULTISPECIES: hypothetical protein [unclassified Flavobacterium]OYU81774.1 MAG: hypothetical protein CFE23_02500 [Flavobacterium sp. BFFFF1]